MYTCLSSYIIQEYDSNTFSWKSKIIDKDPAHKTLQSSNFEVINKEILWLTPNLDDRLEISVERLKKDLFLFSGCAKYKFTLILRHYHKSLPSYHGIPKEMMIFPWIVLNSGTIVERIYAI